MATIVAADVLVFRLRRRPLEVGDLKEAEISFLHLAKSRRDDRAVILYLDLMVLVRSEDFQDAVARRRHVGYRRLHVIDCRPSVVVGLLVECDDEAGRAIGSNLSATRAVTRR